MQPFKAFYIKSLALSGFKRYREPAFFEFGPLTRITGGNHVGKSSLADGIAFAVTGLTLYGEHRIDRLYCDAMDKRDAQVTMTFTDERGESHELIRRRKSDKMSVYLDRCPVTQAELTNLFGETDLFLTLFNPLYFIEVLEAKEHRGRKLLERYLKVVPKEEVLTQMGTLSALVEEMDLLSPEADLSQVREDIREQEEARTYFEGQVDLISMQSRDRVNAKVSLAEQLAAMDTELSALEEKRKTGVDMRALEEAAADLRARLEELYRDEVSMPDAAAASEAVQEAMALVMALETTQFQFEGAEKLIAALAELNAHYARHTRERANKGAIHSGTACPTCHRAITEENLQDVLNAADVVLAEIVQSGLAKKAEVLSLQEEEMKAKALFESQREQHLKAAQAQLATARHEMSGLTEHYENDRKRHQKDLDQLTLQLQAAETALEQGGLTDEESARRSELLVQRSICEEDLVRQGDQPNGESEDVDPQRGLDHALEVLKEKHDVEEAIKRYIAIKNGLMAEQLQMDNVTIRLFDAAKSSGEAQDVFRFEYEGRSYVSLSHSEKILAGLELSSLMARLSGRTYPIFIDDAESLERIGSLTQGCQVLLSCVVAGTDLTVSSPGYPEPSQDKSQAAA